MCLQLQSLWWMKNFCVPVTANDRRRIYPGCCISELSKPGINFFFCNEKKLLSVKFQLFTMSWRQQSNNKEQDTNWGKCGNFHHRNRFPWTAEDMICGPAEKKYIERHHESSRLACLRSWNCPFLLPFLPPSLSTVLHTCLISKVLRGLASGTVTKMKCSGWELRRGRREGWDGEQSLAAVPQGRGSQAVTALAWLTADS